MKGTQRIVLFWLLLCCGISILWGISIGQASPNGMSDFKGIYYDARCLLQHIDPYKLGAPLRVYQAEEGGRTSPPEVIRQILLRNVYLPTTSIFIAPFAMLPWGTAHLLWMFLTAASLILAGFLMLCSGGTSAPVIVGSLICFLLVNTEAVIAIGNPAGIAVSLCVVAVWCFLEDRFAWAGILCLAVSLAIKPHDAGLVWLYFLLAGGVYRKRALQTLLITSIFGLASILWVTPIAPQWMQELHSNLLVTSASGGTSDPGPLSAVNGNGPSMIICLQSALSVFRNDPRFYNPVSYLICGTLLLVWSVRTLRLRLSQTSAWFALSAVVPFTILITYHRPYDAKLLLLAVPACAILWAEGGPTRWLALLATSAGIVSTADIPLTIHLMLTKNMRIPTEGFSGQILTVVVMRPVPLILLAMGIFYLWIYLRRDSAPAATADTGDTRKTQRELIPA
jgi:hypothetical protein